MGARRFQFSVGNLMLAVTAAAAWCAVSSRSIRGNLTAPAVVSLVSGAALFVGALLGGVRGLFFGSLLGLAILVLGVIVMALLAVLGIHV